MLNLDKASDNDLRQMVKILEALELEAERNKFYKMWPKFYDWQKDWMNATSWARENMLMAANRVGKTYTGTYLDACHLLGEYDKEFQGHKFAHAPTCWLLGATGEKCRDLLQTALFGEYKDKKFSGGIIPAERIDSWESAAGTVNLMRSVWVKHSSGHLSKVQFWSYSQGQHVLMGDDIDWFHIDEEPKDQTIRPQVITRTATGDKGKGGRGIYTFTPENGRTETVITFMDKPSEYMHMTRAGWDDAPHLAEETKKALLAGYPPHQRDMRTKGIPMLGHGRIYDMSEDFISCEPFDIPSHFHVIGGMDFGFDHPQAQVRLAIDRDNDIIYLTHAWKRSHVSANDAWGACRWQKDVPIAWPHDGLMHEKGRDDAKQQRDHYQEAGFNMLYDRATWDGKSNSVEQGILEIRQRMQMGKFVVFRSCRDFYDEFLQYHRDDKGKIVKVRDDILDAVRYAYMMQRYAIPIAELGAGKKKIDIDALHRASARGW